jgi:hypothetical protein
MTPPQPQPFAVAPAPSMMVDGHGSVSGQLEYSPFALSGELDRNPLLEAHWEVSLGMAISTELRGPERGLLASVGRQVGSLRLSGEYAQLARDSSDGVAPSCLVRAHRLGATARYRIAYGAGIAAFGAYVEGGLGRESYQAKLGPTVAHSVAIGGGFESLIGGRGGAAGIDMGYRAMIDIGNGATAHLITLSMLLGR